MRELTRGLETARYLILVEGHFGPESSKTATSAVRYLPERVAAVVDSTQAGRTAREVLGFGGDIPVVATVEEGLATGPTAVLVGIAPIGGGLPDAWRPPLRLALREGLDLVSGLHRFLGDDPELATLARRHGGRIYDLRRPPPLLPVSTGRAREVEGVRLLTVGTDCNVGKMTAGLEIRRELEEAGVRTDFAATGQTGILIEGWGIAVDAVIADFIGGATEELVRGADPAAEVVLVEGQGSLVHPGYSGVTLGLMHGCLPDAMVLCHRAGRQALFSYAAEYDWVTLPPLAEAVRLYEEAMRPVHPSRVVGIALNTLAFEEDDEARREVERVRRETGLPVTDPVRFGAGPLSEAIAGLRPRPWREGAGLTS